MLWSFIDGTSDLDTVISWIVFGGSASFCFSSSFVKDTFLLLVNHPARVRQKQWKNYLYWLPGSSKGCCSAFHGRGPKKTPSNRTILEDAESETSTTSRWWFQTFILFSPPIWGRWTHVFTNIFQLGWFNHQPLANFHGTIFLELVTPARQKH